MDRTSRLLAQGKWHKCPNCGVTDTAQTGHCADGKYGGCGRSFSNDEAFDAHHYFDEILGRYVCLDPARILDKHGQPKFVGRTSPIDGHPVWGKPGSNPVRASRSSDNGS